MKTWTFLAKHMPNDNDSYKNGSYNKKMHQRVCVCDFGSAWVGGYHPTRGIEPTVSQLTPYKCINGRENQKR